jgi:hypothetical protein
MARYEEIPTADSLAVRPNLRLSRAALPFLGNPSGLPRIFAVPKPLRVWARSYSGAMLNSPAAYGSEVPERERAMVESPLLIVPSTL